MDRLAPRALPSGRSADLGGAVLAAGLAAWVGLGAAGDGSRPTPFVALVGACGLALAGGRWLADRQPLAVHRLVAIGVALALVVTAPGLLHAGGAPLGYANANATFAALGALAALGVTAAERRHRLRLVWGALTAALVVVVGLAGSVAAGASLALAVALLGATAVLRRPAIVLLGGAICVVAVLAVTVAIAHGADPLGLRGRAAERAELWTAASDIAAAHPAQGIGPGRFAAVNPVTSDADLRWAHHEYLQVAAETGLVGLALVLALLGWAYARLALAALSAPHRAALGGTTLTLGALHATVDHVLHQPALLLILAALVGAATIGPEGRPSIGVELVDGPGGPVAQPLTSITPLTDTEVRGTLERLRR